MLEHKQHKKIITESITFRLNADLLRTLREESEIKEISLNTLVNQVLNLYIGWYANAAKAGYISVNRSLIRKMLEKVESQEIVQIGQFVSKSDTKDIILLLRNEYNLSSALDVIESKVRASGYAYRRRIEGSRHLYVIQHDLGIKWSYYLTELYQYIFEQFAVKGVQFDKTENTLSFEVDMG